MHRMTDADKGGAAETVSVPSAGIAPKGLPIPVPAEPLALFNREFSWIEFNRRVLAEAQNPDVPLLERVKFLSITSSNLDEFLMVRVGAIRDLAVKLPPEGAPSQVVGAVHHRESAAVDRHEHWLAGGRRVFPVIRVGGLLQTKQALLAGERRRQLDHGSASRTRVTAVAMTTAWRLTARA